MSASSIIPLENRVFKKHQLLDSWNDNNAALKERIEKERRERAIFEMKLDLQRQQEVGLREKERKREEMWREKEVSKQLKMQLDEEDELEKLKKKREQEALRRIYDTQIQEKLLADNKNQVSQRQDRQDAFLYHNNSSAQYETSIENPRRLSSQRSALPENNPNSQPTAKGKGRGQFSPLVKAGTSIFR